MDTFLPVGMHARTHVRQHLTLYKLDIRKVTDVYIDAHTKRTDTRMQSRACIHTYINTHGCMSACKHACTKRQTDARM